jgi:hypothetical protein
MKDERRHISLHIESLEGSYCLYSIELTNGIAGHIISSTGEETRGFLGKSSCLHINTWAARVEGVALEFSAWCPLL